MVRHSTAQTPSAEIDTKPAARVAINNDVQDETVNDDVQDETEIEYITPRQAIKIEEDLYVANVSNTFVSFDDGKGNILKLGRQRTALTSDKYDQEDHVKALPAAIARHPGFQKFWNQGKVKVSTDPRLFDQLDEEAEVGELDVDRLQQNYVNGQLSIKLPFEIQGIDPNYPNPNSTARPF